MDIAVSGMQADAVWLGSIASNLANIQTSGPVPATPSTQPVAQAPGGVYQASAVSDQTLSGGGVAAQSGPVTPSYLLSYDPDAPFANMQGMVATPDVDLAQQMTDQVEAVAGYRANIAAFNASSGMVQSLLDTLG